jgi:hypothetical protein
LATILNFIRKAVPSEQTVIQLGFEPEDSVAFIRSGRRWLRVPLWLWQEAQGGGFQQLIQDYGLTEYRAMPCEGEALINLELEARSLLRYYRRGEDRHYYNLLGEIDRLVLRIEQRQMFERPSLRGKEKYQWIADHMSRYDGEFRWYQAKGFLEDAIEALKEDHARRELRNFAKIVRVIAGMQVEERTVYGDAIAPDIEDLEAAA